MDLIRNVNGKFLRCGYTTGVCAAAAAKAATTLLLSGEKADSVQIKTPSGINLTIEIAETSVSDETVSCAVRKDGGDDPDATNGILIFSAVRRIAEGVEIDGGEGVGRVTKPGLDQPVGAAAINSVPRKLISEAVSEVCEKYGYFGGISVTVSVPGGEKLALRTFNPNIGIVGGISIIGTSGIVEPMSNKALVDTIKLELRQLYVSGGRSVLLTPGNYGENFARDVLRLSSSENISCSNFIGDAIDYAVELGFKKILLVGHIGKLVKLGIGLTNTHSANGDGRMETLVACALEAGAPLSLLRSVLGCVTTDAALELIEKEGFLPETLEILKKRIDRFLLKRVPDDTDIGFVCFTNASGSGRILIQSENSEKLLDLWRT